MNAIRGISQSTQSTFRNPQYAMLSICLAGMDACWIFTVAWLFTQVLLSGVRDFPVPPVFILAALELGGWSLMAYLLDRTDLSIGIVRSIMAATGLVISAAIALALNPFDAATYSIIWIMAFVFTGIISLALWLLGGYRATERATYEDVYSNFRLGLIAISSAALLSTVLANKRINELWTDLGGVGLWFFVFGLAGLALGNREAVRRETGNMGMKSWGWMVAGSVGIVLMLGLLGQAFGGKDIISTLQSVVTDILLVIAAILYILLLILLFPCSLLGITLGSPNPIPEATATPTPVPGQNLIQKAQSDWIGVGPIHIPVEFQSILMSIAAVLVVAAVIYAMTRLLRRTRPDRLELEEEERVGFGSWALLMTQLRAWLNRLFARFRKPSAASAAAEEDELAALQGRPDMAGTLSVRQIYARLLRLAGTAGYPRASYQTPVEYQRQLSSALPNLRADLSDITGAYLEARYGPMPASAMSVQSAQAAWRRAEPLLIYENERREAQKPQGKSSPRA